MSLCLASAWHPRGELSRLLALLPHLQSAYAALCLSLPPETPSDAIEGLKGRVSIHLIHTSHWSHGRHDALLEAVAAGGEWIHYADLDRLLRWIETEPVEWRRTLPTIREYDCLVIGRTDQAMHTHPRCMQSTEELVNLVFSPVLGLPLDLSAGSKGFSRAAARHLLAHSPKGTALGTDAEWPVRLFRAGFRIGSVRVNGLSWETADRYRNNAADPASQLAAARAYDADPRNWAHRVAIADEIIRAGMETLQEGPTPVEGQNDLIER